MNRPRILLADDHALIIEGLRALLERQYDIVGAVSDGEELVATALRLQPDLLVLDIAMHGSGGLDAARKIRIGLPEAKFLFTMDTSLRYLQAALDVGGAGYLLKSSPRDEILLAIQQVLEGVSYVTPCLSIQNSTLRLSARECEILQLVAQGKSEKEMAASLEISIKTVAFHKANIKQKLGMRSTAALTKYALQRGLI
jgi:DNA-binding NarL/FixJ family response regulator